MALEIAALTIFELPVEFDFRHVAFCDSGENLALAYLTAHGFHPIIDFSYPYGLLTLAVQSLWFKLFTSSPLSYQAAVFACDLIIAWSLARIAAALDFGVVAIALLIVMVGYAASPTYPQIVQALEAALLASALAEQATGRRNVALALVVSAACVKPAMAYLYGLLLLGLIAYDLLRYKSAANRWRAALAPAITTGLILIAFLAIVYGPLAVLRTQFPLTAMKTYRAGDFGFFGGGRGFWDPSGASWLYYVVFVAGFWIIATLYLLAASLRIIARATRNRFDPSLVTRREEIILTCFLLHAAFIFLFFGNSWSWYYYVYFLIAGVAATIDYGAGWRRTGFALCCIATLSWSGVSAVVFRQWKSEQRSHFTAYLWAPESQAREWSRVQALASGSRATILDTKGAAELLFADFEPPVTLALDPGLMSRAEIDRKLLQIAASDIVVVPLGPASCGGIPHAPEFQQALTSFELAFHGNYFDVYHRREIASGGAMKP